MGRTWAMLVGGRHAEDGSKVLSGPPTSTETRQLLKRSMSITPPIYTCALIAEQYQQEWQELADYLPARNLFLQPTRRTIEDGISLLLRAIRARDMNATLILIPADHCLAIETSWVDAARGALQLALDNVDTVYMLHDKPENDPRPANVRPDVCSSSVMVGSVDALIELCAGQRRTSIVDLMVEETVETVEAVVLPSHEDRFIKVVHVRSIEEYTRLQSGQYSRRSAPLVDIRA